MAALLKRDPYSSSQLWQRIKHVFDSKDERTVVLINFDQGDAFDHWALYIPAAKAAESSNDQYKFGQEGKYLHVENTYDKDKNSRWFHVAKVNYNVDKSTKRKGATILGRWTGGRPFDDKSRAATAELVFDKSYDAREGEIYHKPRDDLEKHFMQDVGLPPDHLKESDCQWYIKQVVARWVKDGLLQRHPNADADPNEILRSMRVINRDNMH